MEVEGTDLTYRWQVSIDGGSYWGNSSAGGYNTASMSVKQTENNPGYLYRCKVTDGDGNVVYSEPGEIKVAQVTWKNTYKADGLRTQRTDGYTTYNYVYNGDKLSQMTVGSNTLHFYYDASGAPMSVVYNGTTYYYATNIQGDVVAILDGTGTAVVEYAYDAWGNIISTTGSMADTLGTLNPLRYRSYVYDQETGLYYLQSRYYDPEVGRFLNADAFASTGQGLLGNNMFAYCNNSPVNYADSLGEYPVFAGIVNNIINAIYYEFSDGESDLSSDSYSNNSGEKVTRWNKLDYVKQETQEEHYNINAWRYYNEYTFHEYGWYVTGWADEKEITVVSWLSDRFEVADVFPYTWDERWYVNAATIIFGMLGL